MSQSLIYKITLSVVYLLFLTLFIYLTESYKKTLPTKRMKIIYFILGFLSALISVIIYKFKLVHVVLYVPQA